MPVSSSPPSVAFGHRKARESHRTETRVVSRTVRAGGSLEGRDSRCPKTGVKAPHACPRMERSPSQRR
eukprot:scaffold577_cov405-Prasinococcus_capsulatus_cf.AAC.4